MAMNLVKIIERLRTNNEDFKQLILTADEAFSTDASGDHLDLSIEDGTRATSKTIKGLIDALQDNTTVRSVFLDYFFVTELPPQEVVLLFEAIGSLPKLEQFSALSRKVEGWSIPVRAASSIVGQAKSLSSLRLTSVGIVGTEEEFNNFTNAVSSNPSLKEFRLRGACVVDGKMPLDELLRALSTAPVLEKIELTAMDLHQDLNGEWPTSPSSALRFCYSRSLKSLDLGGWVLDEDLVLKMAKALETNDSLRSLIMLESHITNKGCIAIADMLKKNKTIERLDLSYNRISDLGCTALANTLRHNTTLKEIGLFGNFQVRSRDAFLRFLQHENFVLEDLLLDSEWDAEMNFYLNLNRLGRRHLLQNEDLARKEWTNTLAAIQEDSKSSSSSTAHQDALSSLYYFILAKPHFVVHGTP